MDAWLYETCTQCLQHMVDIVALFYKPVAPILPRIFDLLSNFIRCCPYHLVQWWAFKWNSCSEVMLTFRHHHLAQSDLIALHRPVLGRSSTLSHGTGNSAVQSRVVWPWILSLRAGSTHCASALCIWRISHLITTSAWWPAWLHGLVVLAWLLARRRCQYRQGM